MESINYGLQSILINMITQQTRGWRWMVNRLMNFVRSTGWSISTLDGVVSVFSFSSKIWEVSYLLLFMFNYNWTFLLRVLRVILTNLLVIPFRFCCVVLRNICFYIVNDFQHCPNIYHVCTIYFMHNLYNIRYAFRIARRQKIESKVKI